MENVAKLAVSAAAFQIDKPYEYRVPDSLTDKATPGMRVLVPFGRGNKRSEGVILSVGPEGRNAGGGRKLKYIAALLDEEPVLDMGQLKLALWMSERFFCTVYDALRAMLPAGMWFNCDGERITKDKTIKTASLNIPADEALPLIEQSARRAPGQAAVLKMLLGLEYASVKELCDYCGASRASVTALARNGVVRIADREVLRRPKYIPSESKPQSVLNSGQRAVFDELALCLSGKPEAALLYGVTGSGKTMVYIRLIQETLKSGRSAIVLVPEIALTPQLLSTFSSYFGDGVAVLHSALGIGERYDEWKRIKSGASQVVIGTRSAVFAPVIRLGLIILDEEQEYTYKSENGPRYHARDVAKYRCYHDGALLLLGSATPSVDSMYAAMSGKYRLLRLKERYNKRNLPEVIIADMKRELQEGSSTAVGAVMRDEISENIKSGHQSILFLNRRGDSALIACGECGYTHTCRRCSVSMTYHSVNRRLMCHYCGYSEPVGERCPECGGRLKYVGAGTQKVETELGELFPGTGIIRMDADTVTLARSHEELLRQFKKQNVPILLGTQMVAKGLDFENVTLVGVISADAALYVNDYRAHERAFSLITQVIGRSGRGEKTGRAVIQTLTPDNEVIRLASLQDYDSFYRREIEIRRVSGTPPVTDLFTLTVSGMEESSVISGGVKLRDTLEWYLKDLPGIKILGPAPASIAKLNNRYRYRVSVICTASRRVRDTLAHSVRQFYKDTQNKGLSVFADADPYDY